MSGYFATKNGKKVFYKTDEEVEKVRASAILVSKTLAMVATELKPGITGAYLDKLAEDFIRSHDNAKPGFKGLYGCPSTLLISYNELVVHGIPKDRPFQDGDIASIDCGVFMDGFYGDAAFTFPIGDVSAATMQLLSVTYTALYKGIEQAISGKRVGDISYAIQSFCEGYGYGVVRQLVGHGLGRNLHEDPEVPNFGKRGQGPVLRDGLVIAIEPMINMGTKEVKQHNDGWTITTKDNKPSAHFEHSIVVRKDHADILSDHSYILDAIKNNENLQKVSLII